MDSVKLRLAKEDAERERIANVAFHRHDATALDAVGAYDLVYARFLLTHLSEPLAVVQRMVRATRPRGVVVVEDIDHAAIFCYPACPALDRHMEVYDQVTRLRGGDPAIGPKLPMLLRQAGLHDIQVEVVQPAFMEGNAKRIHQLTLENISEAVLKANVATQGELDALIAELAAFAQDPETLISLPRVVQAWGYRREA
jgi:ubiquinone/menaquinone biosynthesis C-methylase UbiE